MNRRRNGDRRKGERPSFTKAHLLLTSLTFVVSIFSLLVSLNNQTLLALSNPALSGVHESKPVDPSTQVEEKSVVQDKKHRAKNESKKKERVTKAPKRVRIMFEESVARAPASVQGVGHETKTIKYSNDLYEKEDLL